MTIQRWFWLCILTFLDSYCNSIFIVSLCKTCLEISDFLSKISEHCLIHWFSSEFAEFAHRSLRDNGSLEGLLSTGAETGGRKELRKFNQEPLYQITLSLSPDVSYYCSMFSTSFQGLFTAHGLQLNSRTSTVGFILTVLLHNP